jgi:uncharacterized membrane protein required for colicin V production
VEVLQRLQPLDILFVLLWAAIVGWGLQTGIVRQLGMLVGVYVAAIGSGSLYKAAAGFLGLAFGKEGQPQWECISYVVIFVLIFGVIAIFLWRAYPLSRLGRSFGLENVAGGALGALWGGLLLIALLTMLRLYVATPWKGQETSQQSVRGQIQASQVAPVLEVALSPLWQAMTPWFPSAVPTRL